MPDLSKFSANERPNEYSVSFDVRGTVNMTIKAESLEAARQKADEMMQADDFGVELDDVDDIDIGHISKSRTMYRVMRDGRPMQVSHVEETDLPREPDERGF